MPKGTQAKDIISWIDLTDPTKEQISELIALYNLPESLHGSLDPEHLPSFEALDEIGFYLVLRGFHPDPSQQDDTIQSQTQKLVMISQGDVFITLHRRPVDFILSSYRKEYSRSALILMLLKRLIQTYEGAISLIEDDFEGIELDLLERPDSVPPQIVQKIYHLKQKITLLKKILRMTQKPLQQVALQDEIEGLFPLLDKHIFKLEEVYDNLVGILSLQISLSAQRTNEVMRLLTVYSVIFMPLNLIAGIYGMNFEHIPELKSIWGYPMALLAMAIVGVSILIWLKRRGWLDRP